MTHSGVIAFSNFLTAESWAQLLVQFEFESIQNTKMTNPMTGDEIEIFDPPNLLAVVYSSKKRPLGIVRCSRMFFNGGVDSHAEITFEGSGIEFLKSMERLAVAVNGSINVAQT